MLNKGHINMILFKKKERKKYLNIKISTFIIINLFILFFCNILTNANNNTSTLINKYQSLLSEQKPYKLKSNLGIAQRKLTKYLSESINDKLIFNDEMIINHFSSIPQKSIQAEAFHKWCLEDFSPYPIPFYIIKESSTLKYVIPSCSISSSTLNSDLISLVTLLVTFSKMSSDIIHSDPCIAAIGVGTLITQEVTNHTIYSSMSKFDLEAGIINLLYLFEPAIIHEAFNKKISYNNYKKLLHNALNKMNGKEVDIDLTDSLLSMKKWEFSYKNFLSLLPDNIKAINKTIKKVKSDINNRTIKFLLLNALYDRRIILDKKTDDFSDITPYPIGWLNELIQNNTKKKDDILLKDKSNLINEINDIRDYIFNEFKNELNDRYLDIPIKNISFDPNIVKWMVRYLYNYSTSVAKNIKSLQEKVKKNKLIINNDHIKDLFLSDPELKEVISIIGSPYIKVNMEKNSIDFEWHFKRINGQKETVYLQFIQSFGSSGGNSIYGVHYLTDISVLRNNGQKNIKLFQAQIGDCIKSIDQWDDIENSQVKWAKIIEIQKIEVPYFFKILTENYSITVAPGQQLISKTENENRWNFKESYKIKSSDYIIIESDNKIVSKPVLSIEKIDHKDNVIIFKILSEYKEAYFAGSFLVKTPANVIQKQKLINDIVIGGINGDEMVSTLNGLKKINNLSYDNKVYCYKGNKIDIISELINKRKNKYCSVITLKFELENGQQNRIKIADDQDLFKLINNQAIKYPAGAIVKGDKIITSFYPQKIAEVKEIIKSSPSNQIFQLTVNAPGIIKVNGIMVPVICNQYFSDGFKANTLIQLAPYDKKHRTFSNNLSTLSRLDAVRIDELNKGANLLTYNKDDNYFYRDSIKYINTVLSSKYIKIWVDNNILEIGYFQKLPVVSNKSTKILIKQARNLIIDNDQLIVLNKKKNAVEYATISKIEKIYSDSGKEKLIQLDIINKDNQGIYRNPDIAERLKYIFANNCLVNIDPHYQGNHIIKADALKICSERSIKCGFKENKNRNEGLLSFLSGYFGNGSGNGSGNGEFGNDKGGKLDQNISTPQKIFKTDKYVRSYLGGIHDDKLDEKSNLYFEDNDYNVFDRNLKKFESINWPELNTSNMSEHCKNRLILFFKNYYCLYKYKDENKILIKENKPYYEIINKLISKDFLIKDYQFYIGLRQFFIDTGDPGWISGLINEYVYISYIFYETNQKYIGDLFTSDILTILIRTLYNNGDAGHKFYRNDRYKVRTGLLLIRDILIYIRNKNQKDGLEPVWNISYKNNGWDEVLLKWLDKGILTEDVIDSKHNVLLQNFIVKLDDFNKIVDLRAGIITPNFKQEEIFKIKDKFIKSFGIKTKEIFYIKGENDNQYKF